MDEFKPFRFLGKHQDKIITVIVISHLGLPIAGEIMCPDDSSYHREEGQRAYQSNPTCTNLNWFDIKVPGVSLYTGSGATLAQSTAVDSADLPILFDNWNA